MPTLIKVENDPELKKSGPKSVLDLMRDELLRRAREEAPARSETQSKEKPARSA